MRLRQLHEAPLWGVAGEAEHSQSSEDSCGGTGLVWLGGNSGARPCPRSKAGVPNEGLGQKSKVLHNASMTFSNQRSSGKRSGRSPHKAWTATVTAPHALSSQGPGMPAVQCAPQGEGLPEAILDTKMPSAVLCCTYLFPLESGCLRTGPEGLPKAGVWPSEH